MTPRDNGKGFEREVAKALGTTRTGPTGFGDPDVVFPYINIECKYQAKLSLKKKDIEQAQINAARPGRNKRWALLLREAHTGVRLAVIPYSEFCEYANYVKEKEDNGRV